MLVIALGLLGTVLVAGAGALTRNTSLVSLPTGVPDPNTDGTEFSDVSSDGTRVIFETPQKLTADDLDTNQRDVYQRAGGITTLLSKPTGVADPPTGEVGFVGASADGTRVFFVSDRQLTPDDDDTNREDVYERAGGVTTLVSQPTGVADPDTDDVNFERVSSDGTRVFLETTQKLTDDDDDTNQTDVYQRAGGVTTLLSQPTGVVDPNDDEARFRGASQDGTRVFFETTGKLHDDDDDTDRQDVYQRAGGVTTLLSQPTVAGDDPDTDDVSFEGASLDGTRVFFQTTQKLHDDDDDMDYGDVYERAGDTTTFISQPTGVADPDADDVSFEGSSRDGTRVFIRTHQNMTTDDDDTSGYDVYVRAGGTTTLLSKPTGVADPLIGDVFYEGNSADGTRVFLESTLRLTAADNDTNRRDVYEHAGGTTTLLSQPSGVADPDSDLVILRGFSDDGTRVFLHTNEKLTADDLDSNRQDVYERAGGTTTLLSKPTGVPDPNFSNVEFTGASPDGTSVFLSTHEKLSPLDTDSNFYDVYVAQPPPLVPGGGGPVTPAPGDSTKPVLGSLRLSPTVFRAAKSGGSISAKRKVGTKVTFTLSEASRVTFSVQRKTRGRKVGKRCRAKKRSNAKRKACTRWVKVKGSFTVAGKAGKNSFKFRGRIRRKRLKRGSYRLSGQAVDSAKNKSVVKRKGFRIVR